MLIVSKVQVNGKLLIRTFCYVYFEKLKESLFNLPRTSLTLVIKENKAIIKNTVKFPAVGVNLQCPSISDKFTHQIITFGSMREN